MHTGAGQGSQAGAQTGAQTGSGAHVLHPPKFAEAMDGARQIAPKRARVYSFFIFFSYIGLKLWCVVVLLIIFPF